MSIDLMFDDGAVDGGGGYLVSCLHFQGIVCVSIVTPLF